jgi:hypothetical protein
MSWAASLWNMVPDPIQLAGSVNQVEQPAIPDEAENGAKKGLKGGWPS